MNASPPVGAAAQNAGGTNGVRGRLRSKFFGAGGLPGRISEPGLLAGELVVVGFHGEHGELVTILFPEESGADAVSVQ